MYLLQPTIDFQKDFVRMRCAVVLGAGKYSDELLGYSQEVGPRLEFIEIARATGGDILSYTSATFRRGRWFKMLFGRFQKVGSALNAAIMARQYDRFYVVAEGVGLPLAVFLKLTGWRGKMVCVFHNSGWRLKKIALALLGHDIFAALITVNEIQAKILTEEYRIPQNKVISVFNWVDDQFFLPPGKDGTPAPFVMACGAENRDYETLARTADRVAGRFVIYGHGFRADNVKARDRPPNMEYMPRVSYTELSDAYARSSIVVVPLNDVDYAAGVTGIIEAMAAGRPIVATASRGVREYLADFELWTVVAPGDDEAMAAALTRLHEDRHLRERLGQRNRSFAVERCSLDGYVNLIKERICAA